MKYGSWPVEICDRQVLTDYLNSLSHLAYTTHHRHQAIIQALFNYAVEQKHIKANPIAKLIQSDAYDIYKAEDEAAAQ